MFALLGAGAATLGSFLADPLLNVVLGLVVCAFGLYLAGFPRIPALEREHRADLGRIRVHGVAGAFLLGLAFSFGWTPCVGPILGSILMLAAQQGSAAQGAFLLLVYSLGLSVPFVVITLASSALATRLRGLYRHLPAIQRAGGILIAVMGVWMILGAAPALAAAGAASAGGCAVAPIGRVRRGSGHDAGREHHGF